MLIVTSIAYNVEKGEINVEGSCTQIKLSCYQLKIDCYKNFLCKPLPTEVQQNTAKPKEKWQQKEGQKNDKKIETKNS